MKNKIINWTFGSVFRTIGRVVAYILIGLLISTFVFKNDYVKADTYVKGVDTPWKDNSGNLLSKNGPYHFINNLSGTSVNSDYIVNEFYLQSNEQVDITSIKGGTIEIPFYVSATIPIGNANQQLVCPRWVYDNGGYSCSGFSSVTSGTIQVEPKINIWTMIVYNNGYTDMCAIDLNNNKIRCPIAQLPNNNKIWFVQVRTQVYYGDNYPRQTYVVGLGDKVNLFKNDFIGLQENENQNHNETISTITNDTTYDSNETSNIFEEFEDYLPDEGIVTQLVTLPISLYTNILNSVNGTCSPFSLGSLLGTNLTLPCINVANYLGAQLWSVIDILMSGFFILTIVRKFIKVFESMSSMKEGDVLGD